MKDRTFDDSWRVGSALIASQLPSPYSKIPTSNMESSGTSHCTPQWTFLTGVTRRNLNGKRKLFRPLATRLIKLQFSITHFLLASWSSGMMETTLSRSSSCFKTDGAFTVTLLSRTVAPRFFPALEIKYSCYSLGREMEAWWSRGQDIIISVCLLRQETSLHVAILHPGV